MYYFQLIICGYLFLIDRELDEKVRDAFHLYIEPYICIFRFYCTKKGGGKFTRMYVFLYVYRYVYVIQRIRIRGGWSI